MAAINPISFLTILKLPVGAICNSWNKRSGEFWSESLGERVVMKGKAVYYMKGEITLL